MGNENQSPAAFGHDVCTSYNMVDNFCESALQSDDNSEAWGGARSHGCKVKVAHADKDCQGTLE